MFKKCPNCGCQWIDRPGFLEDPHLKLVGYQVNFNALTAGIILFNHKCKGTLAILAEDFRDLYDGPVFDRKATNGPDCPGHCLHEDDLGPCPAECECAYVREVLQEIRNWPKRLRPQIAVAG